MDRGARGEPPTPRRETIVRDRLLDRLRERFSAPITVLVAPAGFGKTTLLAQALQLDRTEGFGVDAWLGCNPKDGAASQLAEGLCRSLGISAPVDPDDSVQLLAEAIMHRSPLPVVLVLDDVHDVPAGSAGATLLGRILETMPTNGHAVLSGRTPPPIDLSDAERRGDVLRLDADDLLLTEAELIDFAERRGVSVDRIRRSHGWAALAELAVSAQPDVDTDYLWEEVLSGIEPAKRSELALLAHVGPVDAELAAVAVGHEVDLMELAASLPLVATTARGGCEIHGLWRKHLAGVVGEESIADARRRVGLALASNDEVTGAVRLLSEAGAWEQLSDVLVDALSTGHVSVPGDVVSQWFGHIPAELALGPLGQLLDGARKVQSDPTAAGALLEGAAEGFRRDGSTAGEMACLGQLAQAAWWSEEPERLLGLVPRLFELEELGDERAMPLTCFVRALMASLAVDLTMVLAELDRVPVESTSPAMRNVMDWMRSLSLLYLGRSEEALDVAHQASAHATPLHAQVVTWSHLLSLWFLGRVDEALAEMPAGVDEIAASGVQDFEAVMTAVASMLHAGVGQIDRAAAYLERARTATSPEIPLVDVSLVVAEAVLAVASDAEDEAARALRNYLDRSPPLGVGLAAFPQRCSLTFWYVLLPETRAHWDALDAAELGTTWCTARDLARVLVHVRDEGRLPAGAADLPAPGVVRSVVPRPWATDLALAHVAEDRRGGWDLLEAMWPGARYSLRSRADDGGTDLSRAARVALARLPVPPPGRLRLQVLGPVELRRDGELVHAPQWNRERVRSLLAHLVLHRPISRERLAEDLWPALDADAQSRNLRVTLTHLLRVLEPGRSERDASFLIQPHGNGGSLMLHRGDWFSADIWDFDDLWAQAMDADSQIRPLEVLDLAQQAVALWRGDPSELAVGDWALAEVEERRLRFVTLAVRAGELSLSLDEPAAARELARAALGTDPWSEPAHRLLVYSLRAIGDFRAAQNAVERYRRILADLGFDEPQIEATVTILDQTTRVPTGSRASAPPVFRRSR